MALRLERTLVKLDYDDIGRMKTKAYSDMVDRNISENVDDFVNVYQETPSSIYSRGYPATRQSSKTKGTNVRVSYVRDKSGKFVRASHTNIDDDSLQNIINNLINFLNNQSDENAEK